MEPDPHNESPARKSIGAYVVAVALGITAAKAPPPLWGALLVGGMV